MRRKMQGYEEKEKAK